MANKPNVWYLGSKPEIDLIPVDANGNFFIPAEARLSIKAPDGTIFTVSGASLSVASGYLYFDNYRPTVAGWYEYEGWVKDSSGREIAQSNGYEVIDRVY